MAHHELMNPPDSGNIVILTKKLYLMRIVQLADT